MSAKEWKKDEVKYLEENYSNFKNSELAKKLNRTIGSLEAKAKRVGLSKSNSWSYEEIHFLTHNYQKYTNTELSDLLPGRSTHIIAVKAHNLGLLKYGGTEVLERNGESWTPREVKFLSENIGTYNVDGLAEILQRSELSIRVKAQKLGLIEPVETQFVEMKREKKRINQIANLNLGISVAAINKTYNINV